MAKRKREVRPDLQAKPGSVFLFHLDGNVPSKKNSRVTVRATGRSFPSKRYGEWHKAASAQIVPQLLSGCISNTKSVVITFGFESLRVKDQINCGESILDFLVDVGVLSDDNFKVIPELILKASYTKGSSKTEIRITI